MATRILIVDDEPPIIDVLEYKLKTANYEMIVAQDSQEALDKARRQRPDLVILDLMLPKLDGLEICRALRLAQFGLNLSSRNRGQGKFRSRVRGGCRGPGRLYSRHSPRASRTAFGPYPRSPGRRQA